jgi:Transglutaminase elicitor
MKFFWAISVIIFSISANAELFDSSSHPSNFSRMAGIRPLTNFAILPVSGKLSDDRLAWSETYWPSNKGGIAYRWNHPDPKPFKYKLLSLEELRKLNQEELSQLSPSELYDLAHDDYNYTLTKKVLSLYSTRDLWWEGICHGWAQAAINYPEPAARVVMNKAGLKIPFGSSDVKALLSMHEAYNYKGEKFSFAGKRCRVNGKVPGEDDLRDPPENRQFPPNDLAESPECRDVNAGAFHIIITNMIGILGKGFVADIDRFNDIWNQPLHSYSSQFLQEMPVPADLANQGVMRVVRMKLTMTYGEELKFRTPELEAQGHQNFVSKAPVTLTPHQKFLSRNYEYDLELNSHGDIIGGEWVSQTRPDFLWLYGRSEFFKNAPIPLEGLKIIYRPVKR